MGSSSHHPPTQDICRLCGARANRVSTQRVLGLHSVGYYQCPSCDLIQTERPYWLEQAYTSALSNFDTGAVARDRLCTELTLSIAWVLGVGAESPCLDYGGGHGVLTRSLRDHGYDFRWHDKYAQNMFARGFEGVSNQPQRLLTCFEVWEHLPDVAADLETFFRPGHDFLLVATFLHSGHRENWWYYCPEAGQHVAFFSPTTMQFVAKKFGYDVIVGRRYTLFCKPGLLSGWRRMLANSIVRRAKADRNSRAALISGAVRPRLPSRTWDDHLELMKRQAETTRRNAA